MRKKLLSIFTLLCLAVTSAWADESCGDGVTWSYNAGTLTISYSGSGTGAMANYGGDNQPWKNYRSDITSVVIESGVTTIGNHAFAACIKLASIEISASVKTIGQSAFEVCEGLTSITFASGSLLTTIGESAFYNTNLTSIVIPASVTSIGNSAFESCSNLASVTVFARTTCTLGSAAFNDCTKLQIYVPSDLVDTFKTNWNTDKITAIGGNCGATATWSLNSTGVLTISGSGDMANYEISSQPWNSYKDNITSVVIESGVTSIGNWAFEYCSNLTSVTIPASVTSIGKYAFYACKGLTSVTIPASVTSIGQSAFALCIGLASITFASGSHLTTIGVSAFVSCTNLTSIEIPASVTSIDSNVWFGCTNVTDVYCYADPSALSWSDSGTDDFKSGKATKCHVLDAEAFKAKWSKGEDTDINVTFDTAMKGNSDGAGSYWATYYNAARSFTADANTTVYQAALSSDKSKVLLTEVPNREIPATKPVILKSSAEVISLTSAATSEALSGNELAGQASAGAAPANAYCLNMSGSTVGFYAFTGTIPAYRAYLVISAGTRSFYGFGDDDATAIHAVEATNADGPIYDLSGRRVNGQPTKKGIYVRNGQKFIVK